MQIAKQWQNWSTSFHHTIVFMASTQAYWSINNIDNYKTHFHVHLNNPTMAFDRQGDTIVGLRALPIQLTTQRRFPTLSSIARPKSTQSTVINGPLNRPHSIRNLIHRSRWKWQSQTNSIVHLCAYPWVVGPLELWRTLLIMLDICVFYLFFAEFLRSLCVCGLFSLNPNAVFCVTKSNFE